MTCPICDISHEIFCCPFCGFANTEMRGQENNPERPWYIICLDCGARTPEMAVREKVIDKWNNREADRDRGHGSANISIDTNMGDPLSEGEYITFTTGGPTWTD